MAEVGRFFFHLLESRGRYNAILFLARSSERDLYCGKIPLTAAVLVGRRFVVDALFGHRMWLGWPWPHGGGQMTLLPRYSLNLLPPPAILLVCSLLSLSWLCLFSAMCFDCRVSGFSAEPGPWSAALYCSLVKILGKTVLQMQLHSCSSEALGWPGKGPWSVVWIAATQQAGDV